MIKTIALVSALLGLAFGDVTPPPTQSKPKPQLEVIEHKPKDNRRLKLDLPAVTVNADTKLFIGKKAITFKELWDCIDEKTDYLIQEITIKDGVAVKVVFAEPEE